MTSFKIAALLLFWIIQDDVIHPKGVAILLTTSIYLIRVFTAHHLCHVVTFYFTLTILEAFLAIIIE